MQEERELEQHETHDVPTVDQRIANLESAVQQLDLDQTSLKGALKKLGGIVTTIKNKVFPHDVSNCRHCGRQMQVTPGRPCPVCGKKQ